MGDAATADDQLEFRVRGMDCAEEIATLKRELEPLPGVRSLSFDLINGKMVVGVERARVRAGDVMAAVRRTGMTADPWEQRGAERGSTDEGRRWRATMTAVSGVAVVLGFAWHASASGWHAALSDAEGSGPPVLSRGSYVIAVIAGAWFVAPKAWLALRRLRPDMSLLMCIAVIGAIGIGEYFEAGTVAFLFSLALALETWSVGRARRAIATLMALSPAKARIIGTDRNEVTVDAASVATGTTVIVKPGEKFPLDGRITKGRTTVNQAPITGESVPVVKDVGSEVFAGTVNEDGAVEVQTVKPYADSTLSQIVKMVGEAHARRAPSEQWVEHFARLYTPIVLVCAVGVGVLPPLFGLPWTEWVYQALVLLVIACPCALVISTPVSIVAGLAAAARNGVLVKGGLFLEKPARIRAIAMDKTGTLTEGRPRVVKVVPRAGHDERELLTIAAAIESHSTHPLARAVVEYATEQGIRATPASEFQAIPGKGAHARLGDIDYWIGSHRYLEERGQETSDVHEQLQQLAQGGASVVVVGKAAHVCGYVALADRLRPGVREALQSLRDAGILKVFMLTGDNQGTADVIGREAGVDEIQAELLPEEKVRAIEAIALRYGPTAMAGDGVNDAPALARSDLGIAMGAIGTDAALETADVALMGDDLSKLPWLVRHSHRVLRVIRQNIAASLAVKALFVGLSLSGHASLWGAIAADTGVSLLVVLNALRLLRPRAMSATPASV